MRYVKKILLRSFFYFLLFFFILDVAFHLFAGQWYERFFSVLGAGLFSAVILVGIGTLLEKWITRWRKRNNMRNPLSRSLMGKPIFSGDEGWVFLIDHYPVLLSHHILPVNKIPRKGIVGVIAFQPTPYEKVYSLKKIVSPSVFHQLDTFYLSLFFPGKDSGKSICDTISAMIREIREIAPPPTPDRCMNCRQPAEKIRLIIASDVPLYLCDVCENKL